MKVIISYPEPKNYFFTEKVKDFKHAQHYIKSAVNAYGSDFTSIEIINEKE